MSAVAERLVLRASAAAELDVVGKVELATVVVGEPDFALDEVRTVLADGDGDLRHHGDLPRGSERALKTRKARDQPSGRPAQNAAALAVVKLSGALELPEAPDRDRIVRVRVVGAKDDVVEPRDRSQHVKDGVAERRGGVPVEARKDIGERSPLLRARDDVHLIDDRKA